MSDMGSSERATFETIDDISDKEVEQDDEIIAKHIVSVAGLSFQTSMNRDESLKGFAEQLFTCVTILSVAYLTPLQLIIDARAGCDGRWPRIVCFVYLVLLLPLLVALVLALASLAFHKTKLLASPMEQFGYFSNLREAGRINGQEVCHMDIAKSYCDALDNEYSALEHKHARMVRLSNVAAALVIFSVVIAAVGLIALFVSVL